ncbi:MAG: MarR family transcriptional regulator, partial [Chloroflexales bacterium]|nr:MarR family transcriptional regulator [Chloroflexales bacterium]
MSLPQPSPTDAERLATLLAALNVELWSQNMGQVLQILQAANLSMPRLVALTYLQRHGTATISQLSEHLNLALGTTSHAIDQLVQGGLVERREDPGDRRHKQVTLTGAGAEIVASVRRARLDETVRRLADLPPALIARLSDVLADLLDA